MKSKTLCRPLLVIFSLTTFSFFASSKKIKVYLIGDSTIANKEIKAFPETGWGMPFRYFFDSTVEVDNRAKNGRSTKSFSAEGLWQSVLITPVARRTFDSAGKIKESHPIYSDAVREVAKQMNVPLIDLDEKSKTLLQQFGPENSKWLFNYTSPGEHPNYPDGHKDDTHFSELGARKMAEIVLHEIENLHLELANRITKPIVKK